MIWKKKFKRKLRKMIKRVLEELEVDPTLRVNLNESDTTVCEILGDKCSESNIDNTVELCDNISIVMHTD